MKHVFPEVRGSRRGARLERERAARTYRQNQQKQTKEQPKMADGGSSGSGGSDDSGGQLPLPHKRMGKPLPARDRDAFMGEIAKRGPEDVARDICIASPCHGRDAALALIRQVERDAQHRFWSTTRNLVASLARGWRNELPFSRHAAPAQESLSRVPAQASPQPLEMTVDTITTIVTAVLRGMGQGGGAAAPPAPAPRLHAAAFADLTEGEIRHLVDGHHKAVAREWEKHGMCGAFNGAWDRSYRRFHEVTGFDALGAAKEESKATGKHVTAIEIIERRGELRAFWDIVRGMAK
jgi:hypothetical protein